MAPAKKSLIIVANRLPVHQIRASGEKRWERSPGGLVSALTPFVQRSKGAWVGWAGNAGKAPRTFDHDGIANIPVPLSADEMANYYQGFCNGTIWPLYHDAIVQPEYHRHWWRPYVAVNKRFAEIAANHAAKGALVWVHDYQLQLVPAMLRELRPDLRIGFFLHIPFPPEELFAQLPWRRQLLEGLLGADVVGFQTRAGAQNFARLSRRYTDAQVSKGRFQFLGRPVQIQAFPISIDFDKYDSAARDPAVIQRSAELRQRLGKGRKIILGVDRLDYTKGIDVRLRAYWELLDKRRTIQDCVLVQIAVPSREHVGEYQELRSRVEELVGQVDGQFGEVGVGAVNYLRREVPFDELIAIYLAADVMAVTPLRDGMNLVAKEYVACRVDDTGVLILSEFAGAARELRTALHVNPHDVDGLAETMDLALSLPRREVTRRMRRMREVVRENTVFDWANSFMNALSRGG